MINNILTNASKVPPVPPTTYSELWGMGNQQYGQLDNSISQYNFIQVGTATTWVSGSAGSQHGFAIQSNGTLWAWGGNAFGQLGFNDTNNRSSPVQVGTLSTWTNISSREYTTVARRTDGTLWTWGNNNLGQLGLNDFILRSSPVQVGTLNTWTGDISAGQSVVMMIKGDGTLWGMGDHRYGMLGWGSSSMELLPIDTGTSWVSGSTGISHTIALKSNGTMWSWGANNFGQLGEGPLGSAFNKYSPVQVGLLNTWSKAVAGTSHTMAIKTDGTLWGWGSNGSGQVGDITTANKSSPVQIGTRSWSNVYAGNTHTIAIRTDGTLWAWGSNANGQLGDNTGVNKSSPVQIGTLNNWSIVSTTKNDFSYANTAAIKTDGTLWMWGANAYGLLVDNTVASFAYRSSPVQIGTLNNWASVSVNTHALGLKTDGTIWSWGNNDAGQLGIGDLAPINSHRSSPVQIGTLNTWSRIFAGVRSSLAIKTDGTLWGWGYNINGQLGLNDFISRSSPVQIGTRNDWLTADINSNAMFATNSPGGLYAVGIHLFLGRPNLLSSPVQIGTRTWSKVSVGTSHTMAIAADGTLWGWGGNPSSALGNNNRDYSAFQESNLYSPVQIGTLNNWSIITASARSTNAIKTDGTLWGWGHGAENGTNNSAINRSSPVQIGTLNTWSNVQSAAVGQNVALALKTDNTLWGWGSNSNGQLGDGTNVNKSSPIQLKSDLSWINIFVGEGTSFAIDTTNKLYASGNTSQFNTGYDFNRRSPLQIGTLSNWKIVSSGGSHTIAISQSGSLWAFGFNSSGQLGDNTIVDKNSPVQIGTLTTWVSASAGNLHNIALKNDGTMWAWGSNNLSQLGDGTGFSKSSPVQIGTRNDWVKVSASNGHSLALRNDGTLWSWGYNGTGELGQNITSPFTRNSPVQVGADTNWYKISAGGGVSYSIKTNGTLWGWGDNSQGAVGDNTSVTRSSPVQIGTRSDWTDIPLNTPAGFGIGFANRSDGTLWAWGYAINHQLGIFHAGSEIARVNTQRKFTNIAAGGSHAMAVADDGTLWGWAGANTRGQLGNNTTTATTSSPVQIGTLNNWSKVFAAFQHTMSIKTNGTLWGWGYNLYGQLGDGTVVAKSSPVQIGTLVDWSNIAVGNNHALALKNDGTIWSWGFNGNGELGQNIATSINRSSPVQIGTRNDWTWIGAGSNHSMAVRSDGTLWTWGASVRGEGGRGTTTGVSSPVQIGTLTNWYKVQGGGYFTLAVKTDGSLWGWGNNGFGQLGQVNSTANRSSPVQIGTLTDWSDVFPGEDGGSVTFGSSLARKTDGTLWAWGLNTNGQNAQGELLINSRSSPVQIGTRTDFASGSLGEPFGIALLNDGTLASWGQQNVALLSQNLVFNTARSSPTQVGDFNTSWGDATISVGSQFTLARKSNGTLWSWGLNTNGQLGHNDTINRSSPVQVGTLTNWKFVSTGNTHTVLVKEYTQ